MTKKHHPKVREALDEGKAYFLRQLKREEDRLNAALKQKKESEATIEELQRTCEAFDESIKGGIIPVEGS